MPCREHVVFPRPTPVHGQLAAARQHGVGKLFCSELAALVGVDDLGDTVALKGLLNASLAWQASSVVATLWASTLRLATSSTATR